MRPIFLLMAGLLAASWGAPSTRADAPPTDYLNHPKLLFSASEIPALQHKLGDGGEDDRALAFIRKQSNRYIAQHPESLLAYLEGLSTIPELGLMHQLSAPAPAGSGEVPRSKTRYGDKARELVMYLARTRSVDSDDYRSALRLRSLALGYDLAFDGATKAQRHEIRAKIREYLTFMPKDFNYYRYGYNPYTSNRGANVGAAIGLAVIAIWEDVDPRVRASLVEALEFGDLLVRKCLSDILGREGSYREGVLYGAWMMRMAIPYFEARLRFDGTDLAADPRIAKMAEWLSYEMLPEGGGRTNNLNSSLWSTRPLAVHSTYLDWAQSRYSSPLARYLGKHVTGSFGRDYGSFSDKIATVLWNQKLPHAEPGDILPRGKLFADRGIYFYRSAWKRGRIGHEILFSFYSGEFRGGHAQEDQNNFTLYAYGDRFALDNGSQTQNTQPKQTDAHNLILIDSRGQHNAGSSIGTDGRIVEALMSPFADYVHGDAAAAYSTYSPFNAPGEPFSFSDWRWGYDGGNELERADRFVVVVKGPGAVPYFLIADDIVKDDRQHTYEWLLHTDVRNRVDLSTHPVVIEGKHSQLEIYFAHPTPSQGLSLSWDTFDHGGEDPPTARLVAATEAVAPRFLTALVPRTPSLPQPIYEAKPLGSSSATLLELRWPEVRDLVAFNPEGIFMSEPLTSDARIALVRTDDFEVRFYLLAEGSTLQYERRSLIYLGAPASVALSDQALHLSRGDVFFHAYAPHVSQVLGPDGAIGFERAGAYVYGPTPSSIPLSAEAAGPPVILNPIWPNPFNAQTRLSFVLREGGHARVRIFDLHGRLVRTLVDDNVDAGEMSLFWDGTDARGLRQASGVYLVELRSSGKRITRKMTLAR